MQDCMNREQMELASASTSTAVPAAKHRGRVAALIAAIIVAAALLFAMPSLAHASTEAGSSPQATESQEILLSKQDSSTSVNKTPDEPKTPPAYTQQDAYKSTPQSTGSGVDLVTGAGASTDGSYTPGDNKSSINDKDSDSDSDVASDSSISGTEDTDDSTPNEGEDTSDSNTDTDSTESSNGAISGSIDENATDNNQSAVPTDSDSKADDVIATPGDKESADLAAGTTSDKTEEVYGPWLSGEDPTISAASDITTQAGNSITIHWNEGHLARPAAYANVANTITIGSSNDPIFDHNGSLICKAGDSYSVTNAADAVSKGLDAVNSSTAYYFRYGAQFIQWTFTAQQTTGTLTRDVLVSGATTFANLNTQSLYTQGRYSNIHAYPVFSWNNRTIQFLSAETNLPISGFGGSSPANTVYENLPDHSGTNNQWIAQDALNAATKGTTPITTGMTQADIINSVFNFRASTTYNANLWKNVNVAESENSTSFKISFEVGSANTGKVTVTGTTFEVANNGTTKPTIAQINGAGASATDANKNDGWVLDGTKWTYTMGTSTPVVINSLSELANVAITANTVLSPVMKQNTYSVILNAGQAPSLSGVTSPINPGSYTGTVTLGNPTWAGHTFKGWYTTQQSAVDAAPGTNDKKINTGTAYNTINTTFSATADETTTSRTLYAWWDANKLTVTYNANQNSNGGAVANMPNPSSVQVSYGASHTVSTTQPTSNGFTFKGWATSATGAVAYAAGATISNITAAVNLFAVWEEKTGYTVKFNQTTPGTTSTSVHATQGPMAWTGSVTVAAAPTAPTGYTFDGWYTTMTGSTVGGTKLTGATTYKALLALIDSTAPDTTTTINLYAKYTEKDRVTVTLNLNGTGATYNNTSSNYVSSSLLNGSNWSIPTITNPSRPGYNFAGWAASAAGAAPIRNAGDTLTNITANTILYAKWTPAKVTITYKQSSTGDLAGVTNVASSTAYTKTVDYGTTLVVPSGSSMFTRTGYNFQNWAYVTGTNGSGSIVVGGGNLIIDTDHIKLVPTGSSEAGTLAYTAEIYPNWQAYSYTIAWNTQGGNTITSTTGLKSDSVITTPAQPTRAGYTFNKWVTVASSDIAAGTGAKDVLTGNTLADTWTLPANGGTVTAYAIWTEQTVDIRFIGDGSYAGVKWNDGTALPAGGTITVGKDSGYIYENGVRTTKNISQGVLPSITDNHYEWHVYTTAPDSAYTSKWTVGSKNGTAVTASWLTTSNGKLVIGKTSGLYAAADYALTVSPKKYNYTIEYYNETVAGGTYTKVTSPSGSGSAFYGHTVRTGTTAGTSGTTTTVVPATQTGFNHNTTHANAVNTITIGDDATNNVLKLYYDRIEYTLTVTYTGDRPSGTNYTPATQTVKYGQTVTLTNPTVPSGYSFSGWTASGITFGGTATPKNQFTMPANNVAVTGTWGLETFIVQFQPDTANKSTLNPSSGTTVTQNKVFGSTLTAIPNVIVANTTDNYFVGWALYKNATNSAGTLTGGTFDRIYSPEELLGTGAYAGNAWKVASGNSRFVAYILPTFTVTYTAGTGGNFGTINASVSGGTTVSTGGTHYYSLKQDIDLPQYCVSTNGTRNANGFDVAGGRNPNNPKAAAGYKFVGWTWTNELTHTTQTVYGRYTASGLFQYGTYDAAGNFVVDSNPATKMPETVDQSYSFQGVWEKTYQQLHFENTCVNGTGVTGGPAPSDMVGQLGDSLPLPTTYAPTNKPSSAYTFKGWTTATNYGAGSPLYNGTFTMTAGTQATGIYTMPQAAADGGYGVTLYPVFEEKTVTINYVLANGASATMGTLSKATETINMDSGTAAGSTATAKTGYKFVGWYSDAAHTNQLSTAAAYAPAKNADGTYHAATYYAYFEPQEYTITFKVGDHGTWTSPAGDKTDKTMDLAYDTTYGSNVPTTKADTGYGFQHWVDQNGKTYASSVLAATKITGPMTFTAVYEARSGYTLAFETNGGTPSLPSKQVTWTASIASSMDATSLNLKKQGYTFAGWYAKADFAADSLISTALNCAGATDTFATGIDKAGITVTGDTATLTLYAKWNANTYTIAYNPNWPKTNSTTFPNKTGVVWTDKNLLPTGGATLTMDGYTFGGWEARNGSTVVAVDNNKLFSDLYVALYGASDYSPTKTITLTAKWDTKTYTVQFQTPSGTVLKTESSKKWDDAIAYYAYTVADGSQNLKGWMYTPAGSAQQTWTSADATKLVSALGGNPDAVSTIILVADLEDNTKYVINFNKVNVNADGTPNMSTSTAVGTPVQGWTTPGTAIDITNFNTHDYITEFENQNGAGRRADLKGYELKVIPGSTKTTATAAEVLSGQTVTFNVYWVEKVFTITYDLGGDPQGNTAPSTLTPPADKTASWNSTDILPDTTGLTWEGHKTPKWQYKNAAGTWVNVPAGFKVSDLALGNDDNSKPLTLKALWDTDQVVITYATTAGGTAKNAAGNFTVAAGSQQSKTIDALTGTPETMTATPSAGYKFDGWYKDGVLLTTNTTMTPTKDGGMFSTSTYEARFVALGAINYTIQHFYEGLDGTYVQDTSKNETRSGEEFSTINVTPDMIKNVKGFTYKAGITGSKETIASLVDGEILKLYYPRNVLDVYVSGSQGDAPSPLPNIDYPATGINQAHTQQKFGDTLTLPSMTAPAGWGFEWTVSYQEDGEAKVTTTMQNGATFTMPDAVVDIVGTWKRLAHTVNFIAGSGAHGTVNAIAPATLPFSVNHGTKLGDATYNANNVRVNADNEWAFAGWSWTDTDGKSGTTMDPNSMIINADTTFTALWAQTFFVAYNPGSHGGAGFTAQVIAGDDISGHPNVNTFPLMIGGADRTSNAPAADGYRFVGWAWNFAGADHYWLAVADFNPAGLTGTAATMDFDVANNVIFNAIWEALPQDLIYKLDTTTPASEWTATGRPGMAGAGNEYSVDPKPRTDETVTLLTSADVKREGYEFAGWAIWNDANGDGNITPNELSGCYNGTYTMPTHGVTFVPVWDFGSITIEFKVADGAAGRGTVSPDKELISDGTKVRLDGSIATANPGYAFEGWYLDAAHTQKVPNSWLDYEFDDDGNIIGTALKPMRPADGWIPAVYYAFFVPSSAEYTIDYYFQQADGSYAKLESGKFHDVNSEDLADVTDMSNPAYAHLLNTTTGQYKGYTFNNAHLQQILSAIVAGDGSTVLKLYYDRATFKIEYDLDGGNWASVAGPSSAYAEQTVNIPVAQKSGNKLSGWTVTWTDVDTGEAKSINIGAGALASFQMPYADVLATAHWAEVVDVLVEFVTDDGVQVKFDEEWIYGAGTVGDPYYVSQEMVDAHRPLGYRNPAVLPGITLEGPDGRNIITVIYKIASDYVINFDANSGKYADGSTVLTQTGLPMTDPVSMYGNPQPTKFGYTLGANPNRWNTKADGTGIMLTASMTYEELVRALFGENVDDNMLMTKGITLYAMWNELDNLEVKYDLNNDKATNPGVIKPVPDWRNPQIIDDVTGVKWTQDGFNLRDENEFDAAPNGYEFVGWNTKADGTGLTITDLTKYFEMSNAIDPNHEQPSITLYAMWKEIMIKIEYTVTEGGTIDRVVDYVSAVTGQPMGEGSSAGNRLHSVATGKPGYTFKGWELVSENTSRTFNTTNEWHTIRDDNNEMFVVEPDEEGRLYSAVYRAVFEKNADALITYDPNGGEGEIPASRAPHTTTGTLSNGSGFKRGHHTLVGWNTEPDGTGTSYKLGETILFPEGGMNLYAMWNINSYDATVNDRGDEVADVIGGTTPVEWGKPLPEEFIEGISQTPKPGATFKGWSYTMTDADTGETITGVIDDLHDLVVLGPVTIEALYDYEPPEEPVVEVPEEDQVTEGTVLPKTADDTNIIGLLMLILVAAILIVLFMIRRKGEDEDDAPRAGRAARVARAAKAATKVVRARVREARATANNTISSSAMRNSLKNNVSQCAGAGIVRIGGSFFMRSTRDKLPGHLSRFLTATDVAAARAATPPGGRLSTFRVGGRILPLITTCTAAFVLAVVVAFAPGCAFASSADSGSATISAQSNTQTQHSNDPATTKTGSSTSKSSASASGSASKAASSTASSASASKSSSASSAASGSSASAATSTTDQTARLTYLNQLAHANRKATDPSFASSKASSAASSTQSAAASKSSASSSAATRSGSVSSSKTTLTQGVAQGIISAAGTTAASSTPRLSAAAPNLLLTCQSAEISAQARNASGTGAAVQNAASAPQSSVISLGNVVLAASEPSSIFAGGDSLTSPDAGNSAATGAGVDGTAGAGSGGTTSNGTASGTTPEGDEGSYIDDGLTVDAVRDREDDDADDAIVTYLCTSGGALSRTSDQLKDLQGVYAKADTGYCFKAWMVSTEGGTAADLFSYSADLPLDEVREYARLHQDEAANLVFTAIFKANCYTINYDLQGATTTEDTDMTPTAATYGTNTILTSAETLSKEGYKFYCWNTDPDGLGVAVKDGESLSDAKIHTMFLINALDDSADASTTLYARWVPEAPAVVIDPVEQTMAAVQAFREKALQQMNDGTYDAIMAESASGMRDAVRPSGVTADPTAPESAPTVPFPGNGVASAVIALASPMVGLVLDAEAEPVAVLSTDWIEQLSGLFAAPALPPALEVLPATAGGITTLSENAAAGLAEADMTPAQAAEAVGIAVASVAAVTAVAGAAGAAARAVASAKTSTAMNRKRRWKFLNH